MKNKETPRPIDPEDIRVGDRVARRIEYWNGDVTVDEFTVTRVNPDVVRSRLGAKNKWIGTWTLLDRPVHGALGGRGMSAYTEAVKMRKEIESTLGQLKDDYKQNVSDWEGKLRHCQRVIDVAEAGFDPDQFVIARESIDIRWNPNHDGSRWLSSEVSEAFDDAIRAIQEEDDPLAKGYIGVKQYDAWPSQREDHEYGFAPRHGHIWFRIGRNPTHAADFTDPRVKIACVNWLRAVRDNPNLLGN